MPQILFAAEIAFSGLHRGMTQQEFNLLNLATIRVAQLRTSPPQIMGSNVEQSRSLAAGLHHVPDNVLGDAFAPYFSGPRHRAKDSSITNPNGCDPEVKRSFHPLRNGNGSYVAALADHVHDDPMALTHLDIIEFQSHEFGSPQSAAEQNGQHRIVALGANSRSV